MEHVADLYADERAPRGTRVYHTASHRRGAAGPAYMPTALEQALRAWLHKVSS